ncbi:MAG: GFA family protein [Rhodobacteraceae bacterium]|nr:GFA family protein [Paracoccaceae bacterium]
MAIAPGALDGTTNLRLTRHIFTEDAGDYYRPEGPPPQPLVAQGRLDCACLCGSVAFSLPGPVGDVVACHCTQCRKLSGHYSASFDTDEGSLTWHCKASLEEYETPGKGRRGFCTTCGSSLYFRSANGDFSVEAGAVTGRTGGALHSHIFVANKGDYYRLDDGLPLFPEG